ncbi:MULTISPECIES: helix-turn-helix domain-containing protein [unclassified Solwaraspora]|uniref:helix-turn-helix domain-containing protein n=1 Tax=unclassified Solwaraspora TaxID=2627926 RepID=UPI00259BAE0D|nr:helix-turn-helix transcriptional regulator [Solwaraspora sp. WMMA2056]WJK43908.1 helix-turn-helix transcriptional regulator [Solwaraspora sp. WMMA2056]
MIMWIRALKAARVAAGVSQDGLADKINWSASTIAAIETGRRKPTFKFAEEADEALETGGLLTELLDRAERQRTPAWFLAWRRIESEARRLRSFELAVIPGLLQTEEYARAIISAGGLRTPAKVEELVRVRMERQELLTRDDPPECIFILDESMLARPIGDHAILDRQLQHLQEVAKLPNVRIHILPTEVGAHVGLGGGFAIAQLSDVDPMLYLENNARGQVADDEETIDLLNRKWDCLLGDAASTSASLRIIAKYRLTP